ncbi:MAG: hypothetical protein IPP47_08510 [Bryobacterales bacterium]|nr:hypothetical protein [Bryobacterales bacterium]
MAFCTDPSVTYLNKFGYNVVRLPRKGISPMDVLGRRDSVERLGRLSAVWKTTAPEPQLSVPQPVADVEGRRSQDLELSIGLKVLENALRGLGAAVPSVDSAFQQARKVQFTYTNITSVSVAPLDAGNYLASGDLNVANPVVSQYFLDDDAHAFLIVDVLRSDSICVTAKAASGIAVDVDVPAIQGIVGAEVGVKHGGANSSTIIFQGPEPITFGFKAFVIAFVDGHWTLKGTKASGDMAFAVPGEDGDDGEPVMFSTSGTVRL